MVRCPNGSHRNKKTGECDKKEQPKPQEKQPQEKPQKKQQQQEKPQPQQQEKPQPQPQEKQKIKRCPNGTRKNKKTGNCDKTEQVNPVYPIHVTPVFEFPFEGQTFHPAQKATSVEKEQQQQQQQQKENHRQQPQQPQQPRQQQQQQQQQKDTSEETRLRSICPDSDYCIGFGKELERIRAFYDNFDFKYVDVTKIKRLGAPSKNGFVNEFVYNKNGYETHTVLKSSTKVTSDNLFYEGLVGKYINKQALFFPCFIDTYKVCMHNRYDQMDYLKTDVPLRSRLELFDKNIDSETYESLMKINEPNIKVSCTSSRRMCILNQHIKRAVSFDTFLTNSSDRYYCYGTLIQHLFQVYAPLSTLMHEYTHYDLHAENVLLYNPTVAGDKYMVMKYHNTDGTITEFKTFEIAKIIDYGRSFFNDKTETPKITSSKILDKVITERACQMYSLGTECGYSILHGEEYPGSFHYISSNKRNVSHDLRLLSTVAFVITFPIYTDIGKICNNTVYDGNYGTKEIIHEKQFDTFGDKINNVMDAYLAIKRLIDTSMYFRECETHIYGGKIQLGTMEIWLDRSRPMTYTAL